MTLEQIKEQLSIHYFGALVSRAGHHLEMPTLPATGVDVMVTEIYPFVIGDKKRYTDLGNTIDFQVKSTVEKRTKITTDKSGKAFLKYDLDSKNFNDLIYRRGSLKVRRVKPLLLILVVLPNDKEKWTVLSVGNDNPDKYLKLGGVAYWFYPGEQLNFTTNRRKVRIQIPLENKVELKFLRGLFTKF